MASNKPFGDILDVVKGHLKPWPRKPVSSIDQEGMNRFWTVDQLKIVPSSGLRSSQQS